MVLVQYPRKGIYAVAFTTGDAKGPLATITDEDLVNVFVPTTPNPTSGVYILVPRDDLREVNISVEEAFKVIMSAGIVTPEPLQPTNVTALPADVVARAVGEE